MPAAEAEALNRRQCDKFLKLSKLVFDDIQKRLEDLQGMGKPMSVRIIPYPEAEGRVWNKFDSDSGASALRYAHAYWQELKHPNAERVLKEHSLHCAALEAQMQASSEAAQGAIQKACEELASLQRARDEVEMKQGELLALEPTAHIQARAEVEAGLVASIVKLSESAEQADLLKQQVMTLMEATLPAQRVLKLELFRTEVAEQRTRRHREAALRRYEEEVLKQYQLEFQVQAEALTQSFTLLGAEDEERFAAQLKEMEVEALTQPVTVSEQKLAAMEAEVQEAVNRKSILAVVKKVLRQEGYDAVQEMETVTADGIRATYFQDPNHPGRMVEVAYKENEGLMSIELVKGEEESSSTSAQVDQEAQKKLCKSIKKAEDKLGTAYAAAIKRDVAPGAKVKVKASIKQKKQRAASAGTQAARAIGG